MYMKRRLTALCCAAVALSLSADVSRAQEATLPSLSERVEVYFDAYSTPHIYAATWADAAMTLGYLHARDRLWQMDVFRRQASGTMAEVIGKEGLESDRLMRLLGSRRGCEALWESDAIPPAFRAELEAYAKGVNTLLAELGPKRLPLEFTFLGYKPASWSPVDSLVFAKYMAWDQSGTMDDLWLGTMVEKLGADAVDELWPLDRPYEIPAIASQVERRAPKAASLDAKHRRSCTPCMTSARREGMRAAIDVSRGELLTQSAARSGTECPTYLPRSQTARRGPVAVGSSENAAALAAAYNRWHAVGWLGRGGSFGSNNWAVDGTKTRSGKPILANDPHLGFSLPSIWYTCHLSVRGENIAGVTFPGGPIVVIGHNDSIGWGITNMQADAVDFFVETVEAADPMKYSHGGQLKTMERITEVIKIMGQPDEVLYVDSTVHGPVLHREDRTITIQWTGLGATADVVAFWKVSHARNLTEFLAALGHLDAPSLNMVYADTAGHIALHPCGSLPRRARGQGRIPMDGASGENDWREMIPRDELPLAVDPADHFVASANGRPAASGYAHYLGWMWDASYRMRRIHDRLRAAKDLTVDSMREIQLDAYDKAAERFVEVLVKVASDSTIDDPLERKLVDELAHWDYVADVDSVAPIVWLRWFDIYRGEVWNDEWTSRGIEQPSGSWGFSGTNRREPMLEVLEWLTREQPQSIWFDDRATPKRETRDEIMLRALAKTAESLKAQYGDNPQAWTWGGINQLRIGALNRQPAMAREGGPVPGTAYTVNPGSGGGHVGGGASWRMLIDFGDLASSVGVYPGGQNAAAASAHYDDQLRPWAEGRYLPLSMVGNRQQLPTSAKVQSLVLSPK